MRRLWLKLTQIWCWLSNGDGHAYIRTVELGMKVGGYPNAKVKVCSCAKTKVVAG